MEIDEGHDKWCDQRRDWIWLNGSGWSPIVPTQQLRQVMCQLEYAWNGNIIFIPCTKIYPTNLYQLFFVPFGQLFEKTFEFIEF